MQGLIGKKIGMTRVFDAHGQQIPVTVIECGPCIVLQRKSKDCEGYDAVQLGFGDTVERRLSKPLMGTFKKINVTPKKNRREFLLENGDDCKEGDVITVSMFEDISYVDIVGITKGKGFQGVVRRYGMAGGPKSHGGHSPRGTGAIGCGTLPGRVHKGRRMPGHMGNTRVTRQNIRVVRISGQDNIILVKGPVPGYAGSILSVKKSLKKKSLKKGAEDEQHSGQ